MGIDGILGMTLVISLIAAAGHIAHMRGQIEDLREEVLDLKNEVWWAEYRLRKERGKK